MLSPSFPCFLQGSKELWNMLHIDYFWPSFFKKRWKWLYLLRNISSQAVLARNFSLVILISVSVLSRPVSFGTCFNIGVNLNWKTTSHMLRNAKHCRHHALCSYHSETDGWVMRKTVFRPVDTHPNADVKLSGQALADSQTLLLAYRTPLAWSLERKMDNQLGGTCGTAVAGVKPLWHYSWEYFPNFFPDCVRCLKTRRECFDFFFL